MKNTEDNILTLENFEGPIALLLHLVQKNEIDICEIHLKEVTRQFLKVSEKTVEECLDEGAEFIGIAAALLLLKTRALLPKQIESPDILLEELDPRFEIIHYLIDYCRFKAAADELKNREEQQSVFHVRGTSEPPELPKVLGVGTLSLSDLCSLFQQVLAKAPPSSRIIQEEQWKVSDKIAYIKERIAEEKEILFIHLFMTTMSRTELIVSFLAVLELMKQGFLKVEKKETGEIILC